jgi:hypothetical protein
MSRRCLFLSALVVLLSAAPTMADSSYSNFLELRIYPVYEDKRDRFLAYFEENSLGAQEVLGMRIWGQFRDLDTPGHFVWLRGYRSMEKRGKGLTTFYNSPVWSESAGAVGTMLAGPARHVHFLEPAADGSGFANFKRPLIVSEVAEDKNSGVVVAMVFLVQEIDGVPAMLESVQRSIVPGLEAAGGVTLGLFTSSDESNNFPMLPFIQDETVVVWFGSFESRDAYESARPAMIDPAPLETFLLAPGPRSRLYHRAP